MNILILNSYILISSKSLNNIIERVHITYGIFVTNIIRRTELQSWATLGKQLERLSTTQENLDF